MGQLMPVLEQEQGEGMWSSNPGQCRTTAWLLQGGHWDPGFGGVWLGRCLYCLAQAGLAALPTNRAHPTGCRGANVCCLPPGTPTSLEHQAASPSRQGSSPSSSPRGMDPAPQQLDRTGRP